MTFYDSSRLYPPQELLTRIFSNIKISIEHFYNGDPCWEWTGYIDKKTRYGKLSVYGQKQSMHRFTYQLFVDAIPKGLTIDHLCRVRHCCNPAHTEPVTNKVNILRGECPTAMNARKTHCIHGHKFTPENTIKEKLGRKCKQCAKESKCRGHRRLYALPKDHPRWIQHRERQKRQLQALKVKRRLLKIQQHI